MDDSKFCEFCSTPVGSSIVQETSIQTQLPKNPKLNYCPQCGTEILDKPKVSFWTGAKQFNCSNCHFNGSMPLSVSTRIAFWTVTVIVGLILLNMAFGGQGRIGWLGLVAPFLLFKDYQNKSNIKKYQTLHNLNVDFKKEKNGVLRGVIYSILIISLTVIMSLALYPSETDTTTTTTSTTNTSTWHSFNSANKGFSITFPVTPTQDPEQSETIEGIATKYNVYSAVDAAGDSYMVAVYDYGIIPQNYNNQTGLEGLVNGMVEAIDGAKLSSSSYSKFGTYDSIDFTAYSSKDASYLKGRAIVKDDLNNVRIFLIATLTKQQQSTNYNKFLGSFSFTN